MHHKKNRPLSPHLTIYAPQITSGLSIIHRATGIVFFAGLAAIAWLFIMQVFFGLNCISIIFSESLLVRIPLGLMIYASFFHLSTGIRHLMWDSGRGFSEEGIHWTGVAAISFSLVVSIFFMNWIWA